MSGEALIKAIFRHARENYAARVFVERKPMLMKPVCEAEKCVSIVIISGLQRKFGLTLPLFTEQQDDVVE